MVEDGYMSDPDIFADEDSRSCFANTPSPKTPVKKESAEVIRLRSFMGGIPPPPEKTNPQIDVESMLCSWNANTHLWWRGDTIENILLHQNRIEEKFDVYYNRDTEEEEILRIKVADRLISSETSSSFMRHEILTNSAKKRQRRNGWSKSPGSRLSYLAKRRTTFSQRPNLSQSRTISIIKDDKKVKQPKPVPLKRALFQSPDKIDFSTPDSRNKRLKLSVPVQSTASRPIIDTKVRSATRNLESEFEKLRSENFNQRQKQLWCRTSLSSLSTSKIL